MSIEAVITEVSGHVERDELLVEAEQRLDQLFHGVELRPRVTHSMEGRERVRAAVPKHGTLYNAESYDIGIVKDISKDDPGAVRYIAEVRHGHAQDDATRAWIFTPAEGTLWQYDVELCILAPNEEEVRLRPVPAQLPDKEAALTFVQMLRDMVQDEAEDIEDISNPSLRPAFKIVALR